MTIQILSLAATTQNRLSRFGLKWGAAFLGFPLGGLAALALVGSVDNTLDGFIGGAAAGAVIGGAQWLAARRTGVLSARWIGLSSLGLSLGVGLATALVGVGTSLTEIVGRAPITGLAFGLAQWFELRKPGRQAAWWIPLVTVAYTIGWTVTQLVIKESVSAGFTTFGSSGALVFQGLTGLALWRLLRSRS